jgi:hypothetical protein
MSTAQNFERRPSTFLSLAPKTSESYPQTQKAKQPATPAEATVSRDHDALKRRTSSLDSTGGLRFLKLGPVHWGEHQDEHQGDWHEVAIE